MLLVTESPSKRGLLVVAEDKEEDAAPDYDEVTTTDVNNRDESDDVAVSTATPGPTTCCLYQKEVDILNKLFPQKSKVRENVYIYKIN